MRETNQQKKERARRLEAVLFERYGNAKHSLEWWDDPFKLAVAVMLSAQTTDAAVNRVTPKLWEAYPTIEDLAGANVRQVEKIISKIGLYKNKAKHAVGMAKMTVGDFGGELPQNAEELQKLPGVGRKTANIIMGVGFGHPVGIAVDTHVNRITHRLGLVPKTRKDPDSVEACLLKVFNEDLWGRVNHEMVLFGREYCSAKNPKCDTCPVQDMCPHIFS